MLKNKIENNKDNYEKEIKNLEIRFQLIFIMKLQILILRKNYAI